MQTRITTVLTTDEYIALGDKAVDDGFYRNDPKIFTPGMAWYQDFIYDPIGTAKARGGHVMITPERKGNRSHLSEFYWSDWSHIRPPICVVCPNGEWWEIDRRSSNGPGWRVTGTLPDITCTPSIVVDGYHGFLQEGVFTRDLEGRGMYGIPRQQRTKS